MAQAAPEDEIVEAIAGDGALLAEVRMVLPALRNRARAAGGADAVRRVMALYLQVYPQPERTDAEWAAWWFPYEQALADLPESALVAGMAAWSTRPNSRFMPSPGELLDIGRHIATPESLAYARARAAADLADNAIRDTAGMPFRLTAPQLREMKTPESRETVREDAARLRAQAAATKKSLREATIAKLPPVHGSLAPGRHITPEMVALCERQGYALPPAGEVEVEAEVFL